MQNEHSDETCYVLPEDPTPQKPTTVWGRIAEKLAMVIGYSLACIVVIATSPIWIPYFIGLEFWQNLRCYIRNRKERSKLPKTPKATEPRVLKMSYWKSSRTDLPFILEDNYFVYVETEYDEGMNKYISEHLEEIHKKAAEHKFKFIYVPEMVNIPQEEFANIFATYNSVLTSEACTMLRKITTAQFTKELLKEIDTGTNECRCGFLKLAKYDYTEPFHRGICKGMIFGYADFKLEDKQLLETAMDDLYEFFLVRHGDEGLYYTANHNEFHPINPSQFLEQKGFSLDQADNFFRVEPMSMKLIAEEIRTRIEILKQGGYMELLMHTIGEDLLRQLANAQHRSFELPRIKITDDMKIVMPELDNREVKMPALARAMYIFFLRHEEGVEFKQLADFQNEIFAIYRLASNRTDETKLRATVAQLVNPTENKVNECASRIKEAFIRIMDDYQAKNYYLTQKGVKYKTTYLFDKNRVIYKERLVKKVALPRTLVEYPKCLTDLPKDTPKSHEEQVRLEREFEYTLIPQYFFL